MMSQEFDSQLYYQVKGLSFYPFGLLIYDIWTKTDCDMHLI